ncbi:MAG: hypothetical protein R3A10_01690 [Caldilineaceae bacterium]
MALSGFHRLTLAGLGGLALGPLLHRVYRRGDDDAAPCSCALLAHVAGPRRVDRLVLLLLIRWATMRYPQAGCSSRHQRAERVARLRSDQLAARALMGCRSADQQLCS